MIKIYMTGYNSEELIKEAIESIINQTFTEWELQIIIDPCEGSKTGQYTKEYESDNIRVKINTKRLGLMSNVVTAIDLLNCDDDDIIVCVDSDDKLANNDVLMKVWRAYQNNRDLAVCYGGISIEENNQIKPIPFFRKYSISELKNVRLSNWYGTHLRTMKYKVYKNIPDSYKRDDNGKYFTKANDVALMVSAIELAGPGRVGYFNFPTYIYRPPENSSGYYSSKSKDNKITKSDITREEAIRCQNIIRGKKPLSQIKYFNTLSFVIYIKGNELSQNLTTTVKEVIRLRTDEVKELILVELYDDIKYHEEFASKYKLKYFSYNISSKTLPNISTVGRNVAGLVAKEDYVIVHDADLLINPTFFDNISDMANKHLYFGNWSKISYQAKNKIIYEKETLWHDTKFTYANGGSVTFNRKFFRSIGGYDEIYRGWGAEDNDFNLRASIVMGYKAPCIKPNKLIHTWHPSKALSFDNKIRISNNNILYNRMNKYLRLINRYK
jgi:glycosyltransferase involved in cell wall biosynthesis